MHFLHAYGGDNKWLYAAKHHERIGQACDGGEGVAVWQKRFTLLHIQSHSERI